MKNLLIGLVIIIAFIAGYFFSQKYSFKIETKNTSLIPTIKTKPTLTITENQPTVTIEPAKTDEEMIKDALIKKHGWNSDDIIVTVSKNDGQFSRGGVKEKLSEVGGGMFLAKKTGSQWEIVFDGNGAPDCGGLKTTYLFPKEMLKGICD